MAKVIDKFEWRKDPNRIPEVVFTEYDYGGIPPIPDGVLIRNVLDAEEVEIPVAAVLAFAEWWNGKALQYEALQYEDEENERQPLEAVEALQCCGKRSGEWGCMERKGHTGPHKHPWCAYAW